MPCCGIPGAPGRAGQPGRGKRVGKPSPQDEAAATALYGQLSFEDIGHDHEQDEDEDQEVAVLSPEGLAVLERYARAAAERAATAPKTVKRKAAPEPVVQQPQPEHRLYRR